MAKLNLVFIIFTLLFFYITYVFLLIPNTTEKLTLNYRIVALEKYNMELRNLIFEISSDIKLKQNTIIETSNEISSCTCNTPLLSDEKTRALINEKVTLILEEFKNNNLINDSSQLDSDKDIRTISENNSQFIEKNYDLVEDESFKLTLYLTDDIIDRTIYSGGFTKNDEAELNEAILNLGFKYRVIIKNKLSHAFNNQKIQGEFIKLDLTK